MASLMEEIADALARDAIRAAEELGDENLITELSRVVGASSTTTQEAFMTFVRIRLSEKRARRLLADRLEADWPLELAGSGAKPVFVAAPSALAVAATPPAPPAPVPSEHAPRRRMLAEPLDSVDEDMKPLPVREAPAVTTPAQPPTLPAEEMVAAEQEAAPAESSEPAAVAVDPLEPPAIVPVRPRVPAPAPKPVAAPPPKSLAAALALATSLPRKPIPEAERRHDVPALDPDIEIPDGDWG